MHLLLIIWLLYSNNNIFEVLTFLKIYLLYNAGESSIYD